VQPKQYLGNHSWPQRLQEDPPRLQAYRKTHHAYRKTLFRPTTPTGLQEDPLQARNAYRPTERPTTPTGRPTCPDALNIWSDVEAHVL